jgi:hypothetical protein
MVLLRYISDVDFTEEEVDRLIAVAEDIRPKSISEGISI